MAALGIIYRKYFSQICSLRTYRYALREQICEKKKKLLHINPDVFEFSDDAISKIFDVSKLSIRQ